MEFKIGDKVVNIDNKNEVLIIGNTYIIEKFTNNFGTGFVGLKNITTNKKESIYFNPKHFKLLKEMRLEKLNRLKNAD